MSNKAGNIWDFFDVNENAGLAICKVVCSANGAVCGVSYAYHSSASVKGRKTSSDVSMKASSVSCLLRVVPHTVEDDKFKTSFGSSAS